MIYKYKNLNNYIFFILLLTVISFQNCVGYLSHLAVGQSKIIFNRKKISEVITLSTDEKLQMKLRSVSKAREFAISNLYLSPKGGYEYFTQLDREEIGWHVTASYPLKFESYTWWFPIIGSVPYKGYFDLEKAKEEENILIEKGLDTRLRVTSGYSTLGWFSDPLLSPQLKLREDELIALVFHEMAHSTIYFNGDSNFNESYASFVEEIGTKLYYTSLDENGSKNILSIREKARVERKFIIDLIKYYGEKLKSLYNTELDDTIKVQEKKLIIEEFRKEILEKTSNFEVIKTANYSKAKINNETFLGALRYNSGETFFNSLYLKVNKDMEKFHEEVRKLTNLSKEERQKLLLNQ